MSKARVGVAVAAVVGALAGCAQEDTIDRLQPAGYLTEAPQVVAEADWSAPETVNVTLSDFAFSPNHLVFHRGRPTRLVLRNVTDRDHTFVSEGLFKSIAVRQISGPAGVAEGPWVEKVAVPALQTKELWFVPTRYGSWTFECTVTGHALMGMTGVADVVK